MLGYIKLMKDREVSRIGIDQKVEALFEQGKLLLFMAIDGNPAGIFAAAAMGLSSVTVVSNALRLRRFKPPVVAA